MTFTANTNWLYGSYELDRLYILRTAENPNNNLEAHFEGSSIAIGYGYDLIVHSLNDIKTKLGSVGVFLTQEQEALLIEAKTATATRIKSIATELNLQLPSAAAALNLFNLVVVDEEAKVTKFLNDNSIVLENSRERLALVSMAYNGRLQDYSDRADAPKVRSHLAEALLDNNRAEAWFVIRYESNFARRPINANGYTKRAYWESETFGLYNPNITAANISDVDAKQVMQMYTKHREAIEKHERKYGVWDELSSSNNQMFAANRDYHLTGVSAVDTIYEALNPARTNLITKYITNEASIINKPVIDGDVLVGTSGDDLANDKSGLKGTAKNDLIFGENGYDTLEGGAGDDVLYGGVGNDVLDGGTGNDILIGGEGTDIYVWHAGDHDTIIDSDKKGWIRYIRADGKTEDILLGAFIKDGTGNLWKHTLANGEVVSFTHNSPWRLTMPDGSVLELGEDFTDGDFGINLVENTPTTPETTRNIIGDFKPEDQNLTEAGIQLGYDDLNNAIVTAEAEPGREDYLNDSAGNDHIISGGGHDFIRLFRGGDDWAQGGNGNDNIKGYDSTGNNLLEGQAGSDMVIGGSGEDSVYGGNKIDLNLAISQGAATIANPNKGDWIEGGAGDDTVIGTATADVLLGGADDDILVGGGGDDTMVGDSESGIVIEDWSISRTVTELSDHTLYRVTVEQAYVTLRASGNDNMLGGAGEDWMYGEGGDDVMDGGNDNDVLFGNDGMDLLDGGDGDDVLAGGNGDDYIIGGEGNDKLNGADYDTQTTDGNDYLDGGNGDDGLSGDAGDDLLLGGDGTDGLFGDAGNDILDGGTGNDYLNGGAGDDRYRIAAQEGKDTLDDEGGNDTLALAVAWDAITVTVQGADVVMRWSTDVNNYVYIFNGTAGAINQFEFSDKTLSIAELLKRINPENYNNVTGGAETPTLSTGGALSNMSNTATAPDATSNTAYQIQNSFLATVNDAGGMTDVVDFGTNVTSSQASYTRLTNDDLLITLGTGAEITIKQHFAVDNAHRIENIQFADTTIDTATLDSLTPSIATASQGNDILLGTIGDDEMVGLAGNDTLKGGTGNDTYIFAQGDGADTIHDSDASAGNQDTLLLIDIKSTEVSFQRVGEDLVMSSIINQTNLDKVTVQAFFTSTANEIEQFSFSDGVLLNTGEIKALLKITGTSTDDSLQGYSNSNDRIYGLAGNDYLEGLAGDDVLDGGTGNDVLLGNAGNDIYLFNLGGGQDLIYEETDTSGDVLRFGDGILASDIIVYKSGADLILSHTNGIDQVTIANWYVSSGYQLKQFEFADGTIWNGANTGYLAGLRGTNGDDVIYGTAQNETLYGLDGNDILISNGGTDILIGGKGNDTLWGYGSYPGKSTYVFSLGDGQDVIKSAAYEDNLRFGSDIQSTDIAVTREGSNLVFRHINGADVVTISGWYDGYQLHKVEFQADGTVWPIDTLSVMGMNINHNYSLNIGDGLKTIDDWGGTDILTIGSGIPDANIVITRVGQDLYVSHTNGIDKAIIKDWFNDITKQIESIIFTSSGTQISKAQINSQFVNITGTSGDDVLQGGNVGEVILGLAGNDTIYGKGGNDQITGGTGNDILYGGTGGNTYYFNMGDGQDYISPESQSATTIVFGSGLYELFNASYVYGQDTVYSFNNSTDKVTVAAYYQESIKFVRNLTSQADNFVGSDYDDYIYGLGGNDNIHGGEGNDTMYGGDGDDILDGNVVSDPSYGEFASDSPDSYIGGKGNDTLNGNSQNDTYYFNLGDGNDVISEGAFFTNGQWFYSSGDKIIFGEGITSDNIQVSKVNSDLLVKVSATDSITVKNWFTDYKSLIDSFVFNDGSTINSDSVTKKVFTVRGTAGDDLLTADASNASVLYGEAGNDTLNGSNYADDLHGGIGNDTLNGGYGNDSYYFERGTGQDQIFDASGTDVVYFDASITSADISLSRSQNDLVMTLNNNGGALTIKSYFVGSTNTVENFIFKDGSTSLSVQAIQDSLLNIRGTSGDDNLLGTVYADAIYGGYGNDILRGFEGDDILSGDAGNDTLDGGADYDQLKGGDGNDKYVYAAGGGTDTIFDSGGDDSLILGANIGITDLSFEKWGGTDLNINFADGGNVVVSSQSLDANKLERMEFADGNALGLSDIQYGGALTGTAGDSILIGYTTFDSGTNNYLNGGDGNDYLVGGLGADWLYGGNGDDWLNGGTGSYVDNMVGNAGNDIYYVDYRNDTVTEQLNEGIDTVISTLAHTLGSNVENLTLSGTGSINGTGNALDNVFRGNSAANSFTGGAGNDTYYLSTGDSAVEGRTSAGIDVVYTDVAYTLGTNIENGNIIGTAAVNLTGNALNNVMTGNAAANILDGGTGADTLTGGLGDDTYIIDVATDVVLENANEGSDTIQVGYATTASTTLTTGAGQFTNIENITVTGTGLYNLTGDAGNNTLIGNASANVLTGNAGNDVLNGLAGNDNMSGGFGSDTYTVDVAGDVVTENLNEGIDLVNVAITTKGGTYTLGNNIENGTLTNTVAFTLTGNALDNILNGNAAANTLNGGDGNDVLDGKAGSDNMSGGLGNDTYFVDATGDVVTEAVGAGTDSVNVGITTASGTYTLGTNIENGRLTNTVAFNLTGNVLNNYLMGNVANNTLTDTAGGNDILQGLAGIDTFNDTAGNNLFDGGVGTDIMTGGSGHDLFIGGLGVDTITSGTGYDIISFNKGDGQDIVNASTGADNTLSLGGNFAYSDLSLTKSANDLILKMGTTDQITLKDWYLGTTNKSVVNLQVIAEAIQGFSLGSADALRNNNVETFNFTNLVTAFDAAGATANWQLTDARLTTHLESGSDTAAIGGDLAYQYGKSSNLTGMGLLNAQSVIASASFGQTAQTLNNPSVWQAEAVKLG